jgi:uncharacterized membrane protein HdeD (DUF308 family)
MSGTTDGQAGHVHAVRAMAKGWWLFLLRGVTSILFGVLVILWPGAGLAVLLAFLAAWLAVDGVVSLVQAARGGEDPKGLHRSRTWMTIDGILSLVLAAVVLFNPGLSAVTLVIVVGAWALAVGGVRIWLAFKAKDWSLGLLGAVSVLLGLFLVAAPGPGLLAVIWYIGLEAMVMGGLFIAFGMRLRGVANDPHAEDLARG